MKNRAFAPFVLVCCTLALGAALLSGLPVFAHATLLSSEPEPGVTLETLPPVLRLTFSDRLGADSEMVLLEEDFGRIELDSQLSGQTMLAPFPDLESGVYTVQYDVESEDGHGVSGSYEFALAGESSGPNRAALIAAAAAAFGCLVAVLMSTRARSAAQKAP